MGGSVPQPTFQNVCLLEGANGNMDGSLTQPTFWNDGCLEGADENMGGSVIQPTFQNVRCLGGADKNLGGNIPWPTFIFSKIISKFLTKILERSMGSGQRENPIGDLAESSGEMAGAYLMTPTVVVVGLMLSRGVGRTGMSLMS